MAADAEAPDTDRFPGAPHPREQAALLGHGEAEAAFLDAIEAGRLHHAWLIGGPEGIGKATLAYRAARFLLARNHRDPGPRPASLAVPPEARAFRQVAAQSHPNLAVLRRAAATDKKAAASVISVDSVRRALQLFAATAADEGYRICIVDAADDLNASSANALLKLVEEPPPRSLFLIVSHAPQRLLPTIRSRCRRLALRPLPEPEIRAAVASLGPPWSGADEALLARAAALSEGSVRRTLEMMDEGRIRLVGDVTRALDALPRLDLKAVLALAESLTRKDAEAAYRLVLDTVERWIHARVSARAGEGPARLAPLVEVCDKAARRAREVDAYNLDRRPLVVQLFEDLAQAVRRAG